MILESKGRNFGRFKNYFKSYSPIIASCLSKLLNIYSIYFITHLTNINLPTLITLLFATDGR